MSTMVETPAEVEVRPAVVVPSVADVLERAAWYIEEFGHCKGVLARRSDMSDDSYPFSAANSFCTYGAIIRACIDFYGEREDHDGEILREFQRLTGMRGTIGMWNDASERTPAEVIARLRDAAEKARA